MVSGEYALPNENWNDSYIENDRPAYITEAPEHAGRDLEDINLNQYWDQPPMDDRNRMIEEGMGPGPENNVEQPVESESAGHCDPPENEDFGYDLNIDV